MYYQEKELFAIDEIVSLCGILKYKFSQLSSYANTRPVV